jgi:hypothetical protein
VRTEERKARGPAFGRGEIRRQELFETVQRAGVTPVLVQARQQQAQRGVRVLGRRELPGAGEILQRLLELLAIADLEEPGTRVGRIETRVRPLDALVVLEDGGDRHGQHVHDPISSTTMTSR